MAQIEGRTVFEPNQRATCISSEQEMEDIVALDGRALRFSGVEQAKLSYRNKSSASNCTTPAPQSIAWKASLAGAKDTGWKPMLL
jgi:hypothetical protein